MKEDKIVYKFLKSPLGKLIVGSTSKGCCMIGFNGSNSFNNIISQIKIRHSLNTEKGSNQILDKLEKELKAYFNGNLTSFSVPIDMKGTTFQMKVWKQLCTIPYGETISYGDLADLIGNPKAVRAVGHANGNNPIPIVVPCHRVIASDGKLQGYGGGLWRKKILLMLENPQITFKKEDQNISSPLQKTLDNWM